MVYLWPLQKVIDGEKFGGSGKYRIVTNNRTGDQTTKTLKRFLRQLDILGHLSNICMIMYTYHWLKGKNDGFYRIPRLRSFLSIMSRELSDKDVAELPSIISVDEELKKSLPLLDKLGSEIGSSILHEMVLGFLLNGSSVEDQTPQNKRKFKDTNTYSRKKLKRKGAGGYWSGKGFYTGRQYMYEDKGSCTIKSRRLPHTSVEQRGNILKEGRKRCMLVRRHYI